LLVSIRSNISKPQRENKHGSPRKSGRPLFRQRRHREKYKSHSANTRKRNSTRKKASVSLFLPRKKKAENTAPSREARDHRAEEKARNAAPNHAVPEARHVEADGSRELGQPAALGLDSNVDRGKVMLNAVKARVTGSEARGRALHRADKDKATANAIRGKVRVMDSEGRDKVTNNVDQRAPLDSAIRAVHTDNGQAMGRAKHVQPGQDAGNGAGSHKVGALTDRDKAGGKVMVSSPAKGTGSRAGKVVVMARDVRSGHVRKVSKAEDTGRANMVAASAESNAHRRSHRRTQRMFRSVRAQAVASTSHARADTKVRTLQNVRAVL
jgi:hypothetical protein